MATGTITWVNASKQHAFITPDDGGRDLFVDAWVGGGQPAPVVVPPHVPPPPHEDVPEHSTRQSATLPQSIAPSHVLALSQVTSHRPR